MDAVFTVTERNNDCNVNFLQNTFLIMGIIFLSLFTSITFNINLHVKNWNLMLE